MQTVSDSLKDIDVLRLPCAVDVGLHLADSHLAAARDVAGGETRPTPLAGDRQDLTEVRPGGSERRLRGDAIRDLGDIVSGPTIPVGELFAALTFE